MAAFEAWLVFLILVVNVDGELQQKRTLAASRGFPRGSTAFLSTYIGAHMNAGCSTFGRIFISIV